MTRSPQARVRLRRLLSQLDPCTTGCLHFHHVLRIQREGDSTFGHENLQLLCDTLDLSGESKVTISTFIEYLFPGEGPSRDLVQRMHRTKNGIAGSLQAQAAASRMDGGRRWLIFYHDSMASTAKQVKQSMGDQAELSDLKWLHFADGFPSLEIKKEDAMRLECFYGTCIILSFHCPAVIFEQLCLLYALPRMRARNFRIILPWFSTGTMERVEKPGQIATAASLARLLSAVPMSPTGPCTLVIYDIHALQEQFYFFDNVLVELKSAVWLLKAELERLRIDNPCEDIAITFPDEGAHKRFKAKFDEYPMIICAKVRDGDSRIVQIREGEPRGRHCVIVDDLVQSGGTLLECIKPLKEQGATKVSCYTTHGIFPKESFKKFIGNDQVHKFWITDSIPTTVSAVGGQPPFEILSLAPLLANYLRGNSQDT